MKIDVKDNQIRFLDLISQINREGVTELKNFLLHSDFFTAPASAKMYYAQEGGLCAHALARYEILTKIIKAMDWCSDPETIIIIGLLASINKANYFEESIRNKKVYSDTGDKKDELGKFSWVSERGYQVKDPSERFCFGTSGQNAERIITNYIPLKDEESAAIINLGVSYENPTFNFGSVYRQYGLACVLAAADSLATFCSEGVSTVEVPF